MRKALSIYTEPRAWGELLYSLLGLPLGIFGFTCVITGLSIGCGAAITLIGLPLLAITIAFGRGLGTVYRGLGRNLLRVEVATPHREQRRRGIVGYFTDRTGWRAIAFVLLQFPVAIIDFTVAVAVYSYAVGAVTYAFWRQFLPVEHRNGVGHRGAQLGPHFFLDTTPRILAVELVGVVLFVAAPWALRGVLALDRAMIRGLLGPSASTRIRTLEDTRALAVDDSAAELRRIERDLHDGAQARLVSLAMSLGLAKEELDSSEDPAATLARVRGLVDSAHREAKGTIVDLRDLARGIHPPALDNGLPDALATLAARSLIPATLRVDLPTRPSPAVETMVYFCTAELLTNVVKHSGAHHASIDVRQSVDRLFLRVGDDGAGGAALGRSSGSGLTGLADRISTVDGHLEVASPEGGPTLVTIDIPL